MLFLLGVVEADEFFVEGDGDGAGGAELCHVVPVVRGYGLLDGVYAEA